MTFNYTHRRWTNRWLFLQFEGSLQQLQRPVDHLREPAPLPGWKGALWGAYGGSGRPTTGADGVRYISNLIEQRGWEIANDSLMQKWTKNSCKGSLFSGVMIISWYIIVPSLSYLIVPNLPYHWLLTKRQRNSNVSIRHSSFKYWKFQRKLHVQGRDNDRHGWWDDPNTWTKTWYECGLRRSRLIKLKTQIGEVSLMHACLWCLVCNFSVECWFCSSCSCYRRWQTDSWPDKAWFSISKCWHVSARGVNFEHQFTFVLLHMWNSIWMRL